MGDELQFHFRPHRRFAVDGADVDQPEAAHFEEILEQRRAAALERRRRDARDLDHVVRHQPLAPADELQRELALANAGIAGDQHTDAEHVHQHAVAFRGIGEPLGEVIRQLLDDTGGRQGRSEKRRARALRLRQQLRRRRHAVGEDEGRGRGSEQPVGEPGERARLEGADHLHAVRVRDVQVADQRRGGRRFAAHRCAPFAPGYPGKRKRLAVILMQLRDVDLQHPAAMRK